MRFCLDTRFTIHSITRLYFSLSETFQGKRKLCISIGANTEISSNYHAFQYITKKFPCYFVVRKLKIAKIQNQ